MSLQEGIYKATLQSATLGQTKNNNHQIVYEFILDSILDSSGEYLDCPSVRRTMYAVLTEATAEYKVNDLRALGYDRATFDDIDPESPNAFDFSGIEITVEMKLEEYNGREKERWEFSRKGATKKLDASAISKLNALFGSKLKAGQADNGTRPPVARVAASRPTVPPSDTNGDDDGTIPF